MRTPARWTRASGGGDASRRLLAQLSPQQNEAPPLHLPPAQFPGSSSPPPYNNGRLLHKGAIFSSLFFWLLYSDVRTSGSPQRCPYMHQRPETRGPPLCRWESSQKVIMEISVQGTEEGKLRGVGVREENRRTMGGRGGEQERAKGRSWGTGATAPGRSGSGRGPARWSQSPGIPGLGGGAVGLPGVKWAGLRFQKDQGASPWANGHAGGDRLVLLPSSQSKG